MDPLRRSEEEPRQFGFDTRQVHAGQRPDPNTGARAVPIFQTTSYVFEDPESAAAYFNLQEYGNTYSRIMNPTVAVFEERMANLEGGCGAVAFASGIAAQAAALFTLLQPGDHVVSSSALYGGTVNQFKHLLRKMNVALTWVDPDDLDAWRAALRDNTKACYGETIGNPGGNVLDIETIASLAHERGIPLIVDNTFATPYLCRPMEWGADIVVHSATKFLAGHDDALVGAVVCKRPDDTARLLEFRSRTGPVTNADTAWLLLRGLATLEVRVARQTDSAMVLVERLRTHPAVEVVRYPGFGGLMSFDVTGDARAVETSTRLIENATSLGGVDSVLETRYRWEGDRVPENLIRLSVGLEDVDALWADLEQALA